MQGVVSAITNVWSWLMNWLSQSIPSVVGIFYDAETGLTFLGTLAVVALGISVFFLILGLIQNFLHLRC